MNRCSIVLARCFGMLALAGLAGCTALPIAVPDMAHNRAAPQVADRRGPLSEAQSKALLDDLKRRSDGAGIFERHLAVEEAVVGTPLVAGNKVVLLQDGPSTYQAMFDAIGRAKDHINLETYIVEDDEVGQRFADALIAKQRQGVQVQFIYDSVGTLRTPPEYFRRLTGSGVNVVEYNPINPLTARKGWDVNQRDHRKLLIVDGQTAFLGGINISSVYSGGSYSPRAAARPERALPWRDTDLQIEGPVVAEFQKLFLQTWEKQKGPPPGRQNFYPRLAVQGKELVRAIGSSPDEPYSLIYATLLSAITSAENEVWLTNAYFSPDPQLRAALKAAVARGVDVRLLLPSKTDSWLVFHAGRAHYTELLESGVKIYERHDALLHSKTAVIDGVWSTVGSTNLDWRSFLHNDELNAVVLGADHAEQMRAMFRKDLDSSSPVKLEDWRRRPLDLRLLELFGRVWEYWL